MDVYRRHVRNASWLVFVISLVVYWFSVERVGSLWDVGEFILGAYKMQVVHPAWGAVVPDGGAAVCVDWRPH